MAIKTLDLTGISDSETLNSHDGDFEATAGDRSLVGVAATPALTPSATVGSLAAHPLSSGILSQADVENRVTFALGGTNAGTYYSILARFNFGTFTGYLLQLQADGVARLRRIVSGVDTGEASSGAVLSASGTYRVRLTTPDASTVRCTVAEWVSGAWSVVATLDDTDGTRITAAGVVAIGGRAAADVAEMVLTEWAVGNIGDFDPATPAVLGTYAESNPMQVDAVLGTYAEAEPATGAVLHLRHQIARGVVSAEDLEDGILVPASGPATVEGSETGVDETGAILHLRHMVAAGAVEAEDFGW